MLCALTDEVIKTSEIEGERLNPEPVRIAIAARLGVDSDTEELSQRDALARKPQSLDVADEGIVEIVLDATQHCSEMLTTDRLFGWHAALFPTGYSGMSQIRVGQWRDDARGPMQVVSGPIHRYKVHYEAPPASRLETEMSAFLNWFNQGQPDDLVIDPATDPVFGPLIKAGLAHLWFVTILPFDDGNGRITRAVGGMALAYAENSAQRYYSLSAQIQRERKDYYDQLEAAQKAGMDVTDWLVWFLGCLLRALRQAEKTLSDVLPKADFWQHWASTPMNERQIKLLNRMLDGFEGKLTSSKWAAIAKCSQDAALRDINQLFELGMLKKSAASGRNASYELRSFDGSVRADPATSHKEDQQAAKDKD